MIEDQLFDMLKQAEPRWKTQPLVPQDQEIYFRPPDKRLARFRFDDGLDSGFNTGGSGGGPQQPLNLVAVTGFLNGVETTRYLYGP